MSNAIGGIGGGSSMMMQGMGRMQRQDPTKIAEDLFSKLDTSGKGYLEKADLQTAFQSVPAASGTSADDVFASLDGDSDGKVTQQEMSDSIKRLSDALESQFQSMRMNGGGGMGGGMGGMGEVGSEEIRAYKQSSQQSTAATASATASSSSEGQVLMQIMNLAQAYGLGGNATGNAGLSVLA